jgi:hypothetical protein
MYDGIFLLWICFAAKISMSNLYMCVINTPYFRCADVLHVFIAWNLLFWLLIPLSATNSYGCLLLEVFSSVLIHLELGVVYFVIEFHISGHTIAVRFYFSLILSV